MRKARQRPTATTRKNEVFRKRCSRATVIAITLPVSSFVLNVSPTSACDMRLLFDSWPDMQPLEHALTFRTPSGSILRVSKVGIETIVGSSECVARVRVESEAANAQSRFLTSKELNRLMDDRSYSHEFILAEVNKACNPRRIEIDDNITMADKRQFMPYYLYAKSDGSFENVPFTVCGP